MLAGALLAVMPVATLLFLDAASFLISAITLSLIARSFTISRDSAATSERKSLWHDMVEGLRYLSGHPVLRNILIMLTLPNFISTSRETQLVLLVEGHGICTPPIFSLGYSMRREVRLL
jgi:hypothetical protein